jgi:uncharacterized protein YndB with AHSA1/START domain
MSTKHELVLTRDIAVSREKLYRCWTEPELIRQWFAPRPWTVPRADVDARAGGSSRIVMRSPEGQEVANPGVFLEVVPTSVSWPRTRTRAHGSPRRSHS